MKLNKQILSAIMLMTIFAPAVRADLVADPREFNLLKKTIKEKANKGNSMTDAKADKKADKKTSDMAKDKAGEKSSAGDKTEKSTDSPAKTGK